jgi:hypothetical protein
MNIFKRTHLLDNVHYRYSLHLNEFRRRIRGINMYKITTTLI